MNPEPPPLPPKRPLTVAVILAFTPAALGLALAALPIPKAQLSACCIVAAILALVCCAFSSVLLFRRNTSTAIVFGILLALLNLAIVGGLGCAALLSNINVH
ncbi:MAG TPA: hypothetical protein VK961_15615 [Chthoniobacter sp.]|nr:hypothetical protein [Chthoniobacter sp.]